MPIDKLSANSLATGAVSNSLGYTPLSATAPSAVANGTANVAFFAANGNIGIGTSSPNFKLDIDGQVEIQASSSGRYFQLINDSTASYLDTSHALNLRVNGAASLTTAATIDTSGNIGIGKTNPNAKLDVAGISQVSSSGVELQQQVSGSDGFINMNGGGDLAFRLGSGYTQVMRLITGGNLQFNSGYGSIATAYGCRAWVNFNGTGTVAIRGSGNVSSITDNAVGNYNVNFTTAMPDINYSTVKSDNGYGSGEVNMSSTSFVNIRASNSTNAAYIDPSFVMVAVFR